MSQRNGVRAATRRGLPPGATSVKDTEPVLATLDSEELAGLAARQAAVTEANTVLADAQLELQHFTMTLRQRHRWTVPNVKVNTTTGEVTPHVGPVQ